MTRPLRRLAALLVALTFVISVSNGVLAQDKKAPAAAAAKSPRANAAKLKPPSAQGLLVLIRSTMLGVGHAVNTGNFAVLRDLGTPAFRLNTTPAQLAAAFSDFSRRGINLDPVAVITPVLRVPPIVDNRNELVVEGRFPTKPLEVRFKLSYAVYRARWRLARISVQAVNLGGQPARSNAGAAKQPQPKAKSAPKKQ
ncbi:MAG: hypothetical protein AAGC70_11950 [Pseudomonadota bacterium]